MPSLHLPREIHRDLRRHKPQRGRAPGGHPQPDPDEASQRRQGVQCPLVQQEQRHGSRQHEGEADVHLDLRQRGFKVQEL